MPVVKKQVDDVYNEITNTIIKILEKGEIPWRNPLIRLNCPPVSLATVRPKAYHGGNNWWLQVKQYWLGLGTNAWITEPRAIKLGGRIKKNQTPTDIVKFHQINRRDYARHYKVYNVSQCVGIHYEGPKIELLDFQPIAQAEKIVKEYKNRPEIYQTGILSNHFEPRNYRIHMAPREQFVTEELYYSTLFHELVHSTKKILKRPQAKVKGDKIYAKEELVAEMGSCFLLNECGLLPPVLDDQANYINSWLKRIRNDKRIVYSAAAHAVKAVNYIRNRK